MGKKRIITKGETGEGEAGKSGGGKSAKKKLDRGVLYVQSTYNNTILTLTDKQGGVVGAASSGALGFKGAKKGTPFAAAKVGETLGTKAQAMGLKEIDVVIKGVGSGRESSVRGFLSKGINLLSIRDATPVPFNGPRPKKPRRV
ncbi:MAG TPA: 30S ribosomal protein S11 [Candidatus Paceibacterota bacterium]